MSTVTVTAPAVCAAGHSLVGKRRVLVVYRACMTDRGHITWRCIEPGCGWVGYDRPCTNPAQLDGHEYGR